VKLVLYFPFFGFTKLVIFCWKIHFFQVFSPIFFSKITKRIHEENIGLNYGLIAGMEWHSTWYQLNIHTSLLSIEMISYKQCKWHSLIEKVQTNILLQNTQLLHTRYEIQVAHWIMRIILEDCHKKTKLPKSTWKKLVAWKKIASWENFEDITTKLRHILPPITHWS
jgi:hypothetical protein